MTHTQSASGRVLIILTNEYPTAEVGESFIGNELRYIGEPFEEVFFLPRFPQKARIDVVGRAAMKLPSRTLRLPPPSRVRFLDTTVRAVSSSTAAKAMLRARPQLPPVGRRAPSVPSASKRIIALEDRVQSARRLWRGELAGRKPTFYSYWFHSSAYVARRLAEEFDSQAVSRAHRYDLYPSATWDSAWHHASIDGLSAVFTCSKDGQASLREEMPGMAEKIHLSYLGTLDYGLQSSARADEFRLVTCSRLAAVKRLDRVFEALRLAAPNLPATRWTHFGGSGRAEDDASFERLARRALPNHVRLDFKGTVRNSDVIDHYHRNRVDLLVNVSESEGVPVSIMEALSFGIPVAATPVGGTPEMVRDGDNGYLLALGDVPAALARVLSTTAQLDESSTERLRGRARKTWEEKFRASVNYPKFFDRVAQLGEIHKTAAEK